MERKCTRCGSIEILDDFHKICYECFVELDLEEHDIELKKSLKGEEE